ncbi:PREDICTED: procyclic form-specific polypeptide B1-alpha-like, partial [Nicrophorus vespilloides]|uniref:Procyclic form-specific polypeptide B1-alpha-like n=1 Tax=Nicrophorus vespilloides TaxID=110193 RepID=A0ABM1M2Z0_NICVS
MNSSSTNNTRNDSLIESTKSDGELCKNRSSPGFMANFINNVCGGFEMKLPRQRGRKTDPKPKKNPSKRKDAPERKVIEKPDPKPKGFPDPKPKGFPDPKPKGFPDPKPKDSKRKDLPDPIPKKPKRKLKPEPKPKKQDEPKLKLRESLSSHDLRRRKDKNASRLWDFVSGKYKPLVRKGKVEVKQKESFYGLKVKRNRFLDPYKIYN